MKHLIRLADFGAAGIESVIRRADDISGKPLAGKTFALFMPHTSVRTRVAFERGIWLLGGQSVAFPPETLDKREAARDVMGYLANWVSGVAARHKDISKLSALSQGAEIPVINAMTDENHPCEILCDLYTIKKARGDYRRMKYLYVGAASNIGRTWREAAELLGFDFAQCCPNGFEMDGVRVYRDIESAANGRDVLITDSLPDAAKPLFDNCRVTQAALKDGALFIPCPPFYRGEELDDNAFTGYGLKRAMVAVQQAIIMECVEGD